MEDKEDTVNWKSLRIGFKKILLEDYLEKNSDNINEDIKIKNEMFLKTLIPDLKNEDIIINNGKIVEIQGIYKDDNGLFFVRDNKMFNKNKKKSKNYRKSCKNLFFNIT